MRCRTRTNALRGRTHACASYLMRIKLRTRLLLFLAMALLVGANESGPSGKTLAYFTATALNTVTPSVQSP